jgi:cytochrome c oxidase cbb3-type subunit 3
MFLGLGGCQEERRGEAGGRPGELAVTVPPGEIAGLPGKVWLNPGPAASPTFQVKNPYSGDLVALSEGKRLYAWYKCSECHGPNGGGAIGPILRDTNWIYGGDSASIYESIMEGRPHGMPTWQGIIPEDAAWKLVAYVESLAQGKSPVERVPDPMKAVP